MSSYAFYFIGIVLVVFVVGFVGFYGYRLRGARKKMGDDSTARLGQLLRAAQPGEAPAVRNVDAYEGGTGSAPSRSGLEGNGLQGAEVESPSASGWGAQRMERVYERGPGLRGIAEEPIFLRRDKSGAVSFQVGEKPAMPLKYLLDAKARSTLDQLSMRATADFGQSWAILASEDEEGRLTVTRLF
jgi:hypothetical protein